MRAQFWLPAIAATFTTTTLAFLLASVWVDTKTDLSDHLGVTGILFLFWGVLTGLGVVGGIEMGRDMEGLS